MGCPALKYKVIFSLRDQYPVKDLCKALGVSRSGYYAWLQRRERQAVDKDQIVADLIKKCQKATKFTYGYRRVTLWLRREAGLIINRKAVLRIMNKFGLCARIRRRRSYRRFRTAAHKYANLLSRNFSAEKPNQKWVTDITQFPTREGVLYASVIKDLYDGSIVSFATGTDQTVQLVLRTVKEAVSSIQASKGLVLHSDQGTQYSSGSYYKELKRYGIIPSMYRAGNPIDNAAIESFFSAMKTEWVRDTSKLGRDEVAQLVSEYINFYNNERIRLCCGCTPMEKRQKSA